MPCILMLLGHGSFTAELVSIKTCVNLTSYTTCHHDFILSTLEINLNQNLDLQTLGMFRS